MTRKINQKKGIHIQFILTEEENRIVELYRAANNILSKTETIKKMIMTFKPKDKLIGEVKL